MTPSLRALLAGVIDYAGLFPPAKLPLDAAIRNYARYCNEPDRWMLGRFICPAARLAEVSPYVDELFADGTPLDVSALGRGGENADGFLDGLGADAADIHAFCGRHGSRVTVAVLETRLPPGPSVIAAARQRLNAGESDLRVFYESPSAEVVRDIARHDPAAGHKVRCGGVEASAFPDVNTVARMMLAARDAGVPQKFTAGLHHPIRRYDPGVQATMHGFLNVFVAGVLAHVHGLNAEAIRAILSDEKAGSFAFDAEGLGWRDLHAGVAAIESARRDAVISFGSCSFDEPRDDLRALGWMPWEKEP
jgi:hypothetical protein